MSFALIALAFGGGLYGLVHRKRIPRPFTWLSVYLVVAGLVQIGGYILAVTVQSNILLYNLATFLYLVLLFGVFFSFSADGRYRRRVVVWFFLCLVIVSYIVVPHITGPHFDQESVMILNLFVAGAALHSFYQMLKKPSQVKATHQGIFWLVTALFFYHTASLGFWAMARYLSLNDRSELISTLGYFNKLLIIVFYSLAWLSIFVAVRQPKES